MRINRRPGSRVLYRMAPLWAILVAGCYAPAQQEPPLIDFVVTFRAGSETLDAKAQELVAAAAQAAERAADRPVSVEGYADASATPQANQILSRIRAQTVAEALVRAGVDKARVNVRHKQVLGSDPGDESRRVDIVLR